MVDNLVPEKLVPFLKKNKVIDQDDVEKIEKKCKDLRRDGVVTMLFFLYKSGRRAFKKLIVALKKAGDEQMELKLTKDLEKKIADLHLTKTKKQRELLCEVEFEVLRDNHESLVNELDYSVLKNYLFKKELEHYMKAMSTKDEKLRKEGAEEMVTIILKSGPNAFPELLESLNQAGYVELSLKLDSDLKQKKKEGGNTGLEIDLNSVAFPDYPNIPKLKIESDLFCEETAVLNWGRELIKWMKDDSGISWCFAMSEWFQNHEFKSEKELKTVLHYWLLEFEDVVNRGCFQINKIKLILDVTEAFFMPDSNSSIFHNKLIFTDIIKDFAPDFLTSEDKKEFFQTKKAEKERLLEQQQLLSEKLKYNLEGIVEGNQNFELLPIDIDRCELAKYFHSVVNDVRKIWEKFLV
ncbi:hypothetical protein LOTGIDRAFT_169097 [Lottia gigantea]|uniref:CARD domain-containing protein n=1 Tax=Lottia gigantea TaxID=225164 RepID=V3ZHF3_LOTGI|nr:hypothetical protein LOTGIDRAFT_169097 [Lottia gigantea]ESO83627.1 hypothetical protein LOTGIDRAFT_169097 [Lottia gigantea]